MNFPKYKSSKICRKKNIILKKTQFTIVYIIYDLFPILIWISQTINHQKFVNKKNPTTPPRQNGRRRDWLSEVFPTSGTSKHHLQHSVNSPEVCVCVFVSVCVCVSVCVLVWISKAILTFLKRSLIDKTIKINNKYFFQNQISINFLTSIFWYKNSDTIFNTKIQIQFLIKFLIP